MKRWGSAIAFVVLAALSIAGLVNVLGDNADVIRMAGEAACGDQGKGCPARMTRMERSPIGQGFEMVTPKRTVDVRCRRALIFVGAWSCALP